MIMVVIPELPNKREPSPIMKFFGYKHMPAHLQTLSQPICELAMQYDTMLPEGPEKQAGLRKLLEAKDCLVRAIL